MQHVPHYKRSVVEVVMPGPAAGLMTAAMMSMIVWLSGLVLLGV